MGGEVVCKIKPEEWELNRKQLELTALETELAQRELDLTTLKTELQLFQDRYLKALGDLYSRLDDLQARIAQRKGSFHPRDKHIPKEETQTGPKVENTSKDTDTTKTEKTGAKRSHHFRPTEQLKKLYREVAKRIHPDLAGSEKERTRYQKLMAEANRAYREGDELQLQALLSQSGQPLESPREDEYQIRLGRIERRIGLIRERLKAIDAEIATLECSTLYEMRFKVEEAEKKGIDLLAEMASYLRRQIARARVELAAWNENCGEGLSA
ncbi:MAG TPA: molecular chaperone DnaJ [Bacillota bacterium]